MAEAVAAELREHGIDASVQAVESVSSLDGVPAVILGVALYRSAYFDVARFARKLAAASARP